MVVQSDPSRSCDSREIPRPAGENAGPRDDAPDGEASSIELFA
jgi:hypothetical protein